MELCFKCFRSFQAYCPGPSGRSEPSFGRRKRSVSESPTEFDGTAEPLIGGDDMEDDDEVSVVNGTVVHDSKVHKNGTKDTDESNADDLEANASEMPEQVREMIEVNQDVHNLLAADQKVIKSLVHFIPCRSSSPVKKCNKTPWPERWLLRRKLSA